MTADELIKKVEEAMKLSPYVGPLDTASPEDATRWFIACQLAEDFLGAGWKARDIAEMIIDGDAIAGPVKTKDDIQDWLNDLAELEKNDAGVMPNDEFIDTELKRHFGIK